MQSGGSSIAFHADVLPKANIRKVSSAIGYKISKTIDFRKKLGRKLLLYVLMINSMKTSVAVLKRIFAVAIVVVTLVLLCLLTCISSTLQTISISNVSCTSAKHNGSRFFIEEKSLHSVTDNSNSLLNDTKRYSNSPSIGGRNEINLTSHSALKTILFWTGFYTKPPSAWKIKMGEVGCGQYKCNLTYDRSIFKEADALIFHLRCPSWLDEVKKLVDGGLRFPNQSWVLYNRESAWWTKGEELTPANGLFNLTMGFRRDNDIYIPTAVVKKGQYLDGYDPKKNYMEGKMGHVAVLMSMCDWGGYVPRSNYIRWLIRSGLRVDIFGDCGIKCGSYENCIKILKKYKFVLAIENSLCDDYISEKAYRNGFRLGTVPIVMSKANVSDSSILPPGSFINALHFPNAAALVKYINTVGSSPFLYNSYFKWRASWTFTMISEAEGHEPYPDDYFCSLCEKLHSEKKSKTITNLRKWFEHEKCQSFLFW